MNIAEHQTPLPARISQIKTLPPFPLLSNIIKAFVTAESDGEIRPLIDNIETEPNILAKIIGIANSAACGTPVPVRSIKDAIMKLGVKQLKSLVFSIIISSRFDPKKCPSFKTAQFWEDSMFLAHCAGLLAGYCKNIAYNRNEIHSIALVARIGLLALINIAPNEMEMLLNGNSESDLLIREREALGGVDHYSAGSILLSQWNLPEDYCEIIAQMAQPSYSGEFINMVLLLRISKQLLQSDFTMEPSEMDKQLGISAENIKLLERDFIHEKTHIENFSRFL
jgi:HD-like signal output (HDOD) protein